MRVPDPFSCLFNVAASRAQIATKRVKYPRRAMKVNPSPETEPAAILPQLMRVSHADLSAGGNGFSYLER
jgi:hypothetical protein